jgi:hypothetical protein
MPEVVDCFGEEKPVGYLIKSGVGALCVCSLFVPIGAGAQTSEAWEFEASLYGYFPTITGTTTFPPQSGADEVSVDAGKILENLKFAFMGSFEARRGPWGAYTDLLYMDVGDTKTQTRAITIGGTQLPANASASLEFDLKTTGWELAGSYRALSVAEYALDVIVGTRVLDIQEKLNWQLSGNISSTPLPDRAGSRQASLTNWDAVVGVKGRAGIGNAHHWFLPYYLDIGTGESQFTWQIMAGLGYTFTWGDILANWRYLDYQMKSGDRIERLSFSGPSIAATFRS